MRPSTTKLVETLLRKYGPFTEPIVDIGGAESSNQFRHLFKYEVWDLRNVSGVDKVVDVRNMWESGQVKTRSIGTVMMLDTLEHILEYWEAIRQIERSLIPSGYVLICMPWSYPFHDPSGDYWRMSPQALELLFGKYFDCVESGFYDEDSASYYLGRRRIGIREPMIR